VKLADVVFIGLDTETTGLDSQADHLVEIAVRAGNLVDPFVQTFSTLVKPPIPIPATSSAVHHLMDCDVSGAPDRVDAVLRTRHFVNAVSSGRTPVLYAHNAAFDRSFLPEFEKLPWLCTLRLAQHVWPDAPAFNNQVLRYWRGYGKIDLEGLLPHRAAADLIVTEALLCDAVATYLEAGGEDDIQALIAYADSPILLKAMPFGKHRGPIEAVPLDYIDWALGPRGITDMDADLRYTLEHERKRRQEAA